MQKAFKILFIVFGLAAVVEMATLPQALHSAQRRARHAARELRVREVIHILEEDHGYRALQEAWPEAPYVMVEVADDADLDYRVLAIIARAEGGVHSRVMLRARNPYGLSASNERLLDRPSFEVATMEAARAVRRLNGPGPLDVRRLAGRWCTDSLTWAANVTRILENSNRRATAWHNARE